MTSKILKVFEPLITRIPEINSPSETLAFKKRLMWTLFVLFFYTILTTIPLIGVNLGGGDLFAFMRIITASSQDSLAELGIFPLLAAGLLLYFLKASSIIQIDSKNMSDRFLYNGLVKILAIVFTLIGAGFLIASGTFGTNVSSEKQIFIIIQLLLAGIVIIYLDEIIRKGWGLGSGISLFIISTGFLRVTNGLFAPNNIIEGPNFMTSARGIVLAFIYWTGEEGPLAAFGNLFFRYNMDPSYYSNLPMLSIMAVIAAIVIFLLVIKLESKRNSFWKTSSLIDLEDFKRERKSFPKPIISLFLTTYVLIVIRAISLFIWNTMGKEGTTNFFVQIFGTYRVDTGLQQLVPTGGLAYFLSPPLSLVGDFGAINLYDPVSSIIRTLIFGVIFFCLFRYFTNISLRRMKYEFSPDQMIENSNYMKKIALIALLAEITNPLGLGLGIVILALVLVDYSRLFVNKDQLGFLNVYIGSDGEKISPDSDFRGIRQRSYWIYIGLLSLGLFWLRFFVFVVLGREL